MVLAVAAAAACTAETRSTKINASRSREYLRVKYEPRRIQLQTSPACHQYSFSLFHFSDSALWSSAAQRPARPREVEASLRSLPLQPSAACTDWTLAELLLSLPLRISSLTSKNPARENVHHFVFLFLLSFVATLGKEHKARGTIGCRVLTPFPALLLNVLIKLKVFSSQ